MKTLAHISKTLGMTAVLLAGLYSAQSSAQFTYAHPVPSDKDVLLSLGVPSQPTLPKRMNILVWNLHKGANDTFATDFTNLAYKKDLIIAQEMQLDPNMERVFQAFPMDLYTTATSFFLGKEFYRTGVTTASPVAPVLVNYVRTQTLEPVINSPKVTLITQYPIRFTDKNLTVVNIHGINFVDVPSFRKEIGRIYEVIKNYPSPLIFTGDFNSWNDERLAILKDLCDKMKFKEANFFPDNRMRFNKHPLDHFFYTEDLRVLEAKVEGYYQGSDHKPLELVVEYSPFKFPPSSILAKRH
jgi:endonuclease/exonuclease/phosphatase (EEP) superfamily protein YafD